MGGGGRDGSGARRRRRSDGYRGACAASMVGTGGPKGQARARLPSPPCAAAVAPAGWRHHPGRVPPPSLGRARVRRAAPRPSWGAEKGGRREQRHWGEAACGRGGTGWVRYPHGRRDGRSARRRRRPLGRVSQTGSAGATRPVPRDRAWHRVAPRAARRGARAAPRASPPVRLARGAQPGSGCGRQARPFRPARGRGGYARSRWRRVGVDARRVEGPAGRARRRRGAGDAPGRKRRRLRTPHPPLPAYHTQSGAPTAVWQRRHRRRQAQPARTKRRGAPEQQQLNRSAQHNTCRPTVLGGGLRGTDRRGRAWSSRPSPTVAPNARRGMQTS